MKNLDALLQKAAGTFTLESKRTCLESWADVRTELGMRGTPKLLGNPLDNVKIRKSKVPTWSLTLSAHRTSLVVNTCVKSTAQCRKACVMLTSGNARYLSVQDGRKARTVFAAEHPNTFLSLLTHEVNALTKRGSEFGLRLNVASDLRWEHIAPWLLQPANVRGYDYTKYQPWERDTSGLNYRLTYSHSEARIWSYGHVRDLTTLGHNVAMVFDCHKHDLPEGWHGIPVIDGDISDYRWDDPKGVIVGLAAKGAAKSMDAGGFVTHA